ncbi:MAG: hypothetical protein ACRC62_29780, partial [Microcoleus sp.]
LSMLRKIFRGNSQAQGEAFAFVSCRLSERFFAGIRNHKAKHSRLYSVDYPRDFSLAFASTG